MTVDVRFEIQRTRAVFAKEKNAGKFFASFLLSELFSDLNSQVKNQGLIAEVINFVDALQIVSKVSIWNERDKAIKIDYAYFFASDTK